jgi:3-oxoadipate enol-lactonase
MVTGMPFATNGDVRLWFERQGEGPPLLFISGTGGDLRQRPNVFDGPLPKTFDTLAYDQRGHGRTESPDRRYDMADYAADAIAVLDAVGWDRAALLGVSFGGMVAQEVAIRHPDRVSRLVLACTSSGGPGGSSYPLHQLVGLPEDARLRRQLAISDTRVDEAWQDANPEEAARLLELVAARAGEANDRQLEARSRHDAHDRLPRIAAPTLVCAGRYDGIAPVANSEVLAERIPDARLDVFEGGHLFLLQDRRAFAAIQDFLLG